MADLHLVHGYQRPDFSTTNALSLVTRHEAAEHGPEVAETPSNTISFCPVESQPVSIDYNGERPRPPRRLVYT